MAASETGNSSLELQNRAQEIVRAVRQNHALEHATIALLLTRPGGRTRIMGRAGPNGFHIYGNLATDAIEEAAREALLRLQSGEKSLAVSAHCGTNLVVTGLTAAAAGMIAGRGYSGLGKFIRVAEASILAAVIAQPLGRLAQKHITTTPNLDNVEISRVIRKGQGKRIRHEVEVIHC